MIESLATATNSQLVAEIAATEDALATCNLLFHQLSALGYYLAEPTKKTTADLLAANLATLKDALASRTEAGV